MRRMKIQAEEILQKPKGIKKSYLRVLLIYCITIVGFSILLAFGVKYGPFVNTSSNDAISFSRYLFENTTLANASTIISITAFALMGFPFICLFSLWMIGINQVSRSPYFHFFLWITCALLLILLLIAIILFTRAAVYNFAAIYN